jgi:energy-converting hydrogenase Eha subunit C
MDFATLFVLLALLLDFILLFTREYYLDVGIAAVILNVMAILMLPALGLSDPVMWVARAMFFTLAVFVMLNAGLRR